MFGHDFGGAGGIGCDLEVDYYLHGEEAARGCRIAGGAGEEGLAVEAENADDAAR